VRLKDRVLFDRQASEFEICIVNCVRRSLPQFRGFRGSKVRNASVDRRVVDMTRRYYDAVYLYLGHKARTTLFIGCRQTVSWTFLSFHHSNVQLRSF
jgi:hypothetical protein